ncbi:MAG TPA: hypothetical protein VNM91_07715 [Dehalococcoidia bacterium]|nr:hypothetical protein [Dehalococcoidia bacterium]
MFERNEMRAKTKERLRPGMRVVASDGQMLGKVKEVSPSFFKVDVRMGRDYWLGSDHVSDVTGSDAILDFESNRARSYKVDSPRLRDEDDPLGRGVAPALTEEDMLRQRAIMERELAEQSQRLPGLEPTPTEERPRREVETIPEDHAGFGALAGKSVPYAPAAEGRQQPRPARADEPPGQVVESAPGEGVEPLAMAEEAFEGRVADVEVDDDTPAKPRRDAHMAP